jgi:hypothetical protein
MIPRADAQSDLLDAIIWWTERYRDLHCDPDEHYEVNKGKARQGFYERFGIDVLQALRGNSASMMELTKKVREDV